MKTILTFSICLGLLINGAYGQIDTPKPIACKSGIIEYKYSGDKDGKATHYFDDYGMKSAMYTEIFQEGELSQGWSVSFGDYQYMWDPSKPGEGMKMKNPMLAWIKQSSKDSLESYIESTYAKMGMVKSGKEIFLGKECDVIKGNKSKVLIWNGILLYMEMNFGKITSKQEATKIDVNVPVKASMFELPANVKFVEMSLFGR